MNRPQRLFELDALRGMSLLGIVLMNILIFSFPYDNIDLTKHLSGFDVTIIRSVKLIIISSFYPIFTFLFGYGLAIMYQNTQRKQLRFYPIIYRRLFFISSWITAWLFYIQWRYLIYVCSNRNGCSAINKVIKKYSNKYCINFIYGENHSDTNASRYFTCYVWS